MTTFVRQSEAFLAAYSAARLQGITAFVQSVDAGSFTAAAKRLGLSKSAIGKSVARLEERLGVRVLDRTTRRLGLTAEGVDFYQSCLRVLAELDEAEARAASRRRGVSGVLRVSLPVSFGRRWVMPILLDVASKHPELTLDVAFTDRHVDLVEEGIDLAVRLGEPGNSATLAARRLGTQKSVVCGSPAYFEARGKPRSIEELTQHDCFTFAKGGNVLPWNLAGPNGRSVSVKIKGRHTISNGDALRDAVLTGMGIAQLSTWLVSDELRSGKLRVALALGAVDDLPIHALWPATRDLAPKIRAAVDVLTQAFIPKPPWEKGLKLDV